MATPGPAKGKGGAPRKKGGSLLTKGSNKGYKKVTVGPKSKGKQEYQHRVVAGATKLGKNKVVHHKDGSRGGNTKGNLQVTDRKNHPRIH